MSVSPRRLEQDDRFFTERRLRNETLRWRHVANGRVVPESCCCQRRQDFLRLKRSEVYANVMTVQRSCWCPCNHQARSVIGAEFREQLHSSHLQSSSA
jgi:hypothetical protein